MHVTSEPSLIGPALKYGAKEGDFECQSLTGLQKSGHLLQSLSLTLNASQSLTGL